MKNNLYRFFMTCPKGLSDLLSDELNEFNIHNQLKLPTGVRFECDLDTAQMIVFHSAIGSRLLLKLDEFKVRRPKELYENVARYPWEDLFTINETFKVDVKLGFQGHENWDFRNPIFLAQTVKDGVVDRFKKMTAKRPDVQLKDPDFEVVVFIEQPKALKVSLYVDYAGRPLSNRGYRKTNYKAPLRENLARAVVRSAGVKERKIIFDPFCGTGTLLIEAAMEVLNIPSQVLWAHKGKTLSFEKLKPPFCGNFKANISKVREMTGIEKEIVFIGSDNDPRSLEILEEQIKLMGLPTEYFNLSQKDALSYEDIKTEPGLIISNLPYGIRSEEFEQIEGLYHDFGEVLKNQFQGWQATMLLASIELRKKISLKTSKRQEMFNGNLKCQLATYNLY